VAASTDAARGPAPGPAGGRRIDRVLTGCVFVVALVAYLRTMRPTFGWGDSSELITAAYHLGIGHSPGYPTWMLVAYPFAHLPIGDVAFRVNFMTALLGAVGVTLLYSAYRTIAGGRVAALVGALCFAFSATFWDITTEAEVYTLHVCFAGLVVLLVLRWRRAPQDRWLYLLAWVIGISLGNHALTVLMAPPILYLVWAEQGWRFFTRRRVLTAAGLLLLGMSVYLYLPLRGAADPPPHVNNPRNLAELWAQLTSPGAQSAMFDAGIVTVLGRAKHFLLIRPLGEFGYAGCGLAAVGLVLLFRRDRRLAIFLCLIGLLDVAYSVNFSIFDIYIYYLPLYLVLAAFISVGAWGALALAAALVERLARRGVLGAPLFRHAPAAALLLTVPFSLFTAHLALVDGSEDYSSELFARAVFDHVEPDCMILADWWTIAPLGYLKHVEGRRADVIMFAAPSIAADSEFADFAQEDVLRRYPAVYFVEELTDRADMLREQWWLVPEGPVSRLVMDRPDPDSLLADVPPTPIARFGDQVALVRAELEGGELRPGEPLGLRLYWTPLSGYGGEALGVVLLLQDEEARREGEGAGATRIWQETNVLGHDLYPLAEWRAGEVLEEKHWIYVSEWVRPGSYELLLRVREPGRSASLACDRSLPEGDARDYPIARIEVGEPATPPTRGRLPAMVALLRR